MIFRVILCSTGGLTDGYTTIKTDDISTAQKLAKKWGEQRIKQLGFHSYAGYVKLVIDIDKIKIML